jgi:hypothetical protein
MTMEFEIEWVDPSLVICRTSGVASVEGYQAMMAALTSQPQFQPGVDLIVDLRARFAGDVAMRAAGVVGPGSPMRYGLGRMFEAFVDSNPGTKITVFETVEEAMTWLRGTDATPS